MAGWSSRFAKIRRQTQTVYQNGCNQWDRQRDRSLMERKWLDRFIFTIPDQGSVLDLGCGTGEPVSAYLIAKELKLTGIDYAPAMIEQASHRFPQANWQVMDMRSMELNFRFHGILSWNGSFHLTAKEQRKLIPKLYEALKPGGQLLLTIGHEHGEVTGIVAGREVYHASLSPSEYQELCDAAGFKKVTLQLRDPECGHHSILLARKD